MGPSLGDPEDNLRNGAFRIRNGSIPVHQLFHGTANRPRRMHAFQSETKRLNLAWQGKIGVVLIMVARTAELDRRIGERLRAARLMKGMSQGELGKQLSITFQQVQKYEKGTNRVSASALLKISEALKTDLLYFFSGDLPASAASGSIAFSEATAVDFDILRSVVKIRDTNTKRRIANLVASLVDPPAPPEG